MKVITIQIPFELSKRILDQEESLDYECEDYDDMIRSDQFYRKLMSELIPIVKNAVKT